MQQRFGRRREASLSAQTEDTALMQPQVNKQQSPADRQTTNVRGKKDRVIPVCQTELAKAVNTHGHTRARTPGAVMTR